MKATNPPIKVKATYNATKKTVWQALTQLDQMQKWYFEQLQSFQPKVGFKTQFLIALDERKYTHLWKITEVIPNQKIAYSWKYEECEGEGLVIFELVENDGRTTLNFTNEIIKDFPDDRPEFTRESAQGGWDYFLIERLKPFVEGKGYI